MVGRSSSMSYVATRRGAKLRSKVQGIDPRAVWWEHKFVFKPFVFTTYLPPKIILRDFHLITADGKLVTYEYFTRSRALQLDENDKLIGMNINGILLLKAGTNTLKIWYGIWDKFLTLQVPSDLQDLSISFKYNRVFGYSPSQKALLFWEISYDKSVKQIVYHLPEQYENIKPFGFINEKLFVFKAQVRTTEGQTTKKQYKLFQLDYNSGTIAEAIIEYTKTVNNKTETTLLDVESAEAIEDDNGLYIFSKTLSTYVRQDDKIFYFDHILKANSIQALKIGPTYEASHIYLLVYKADETYEILVKTSEDGRVSSIYSGALEKLNLQYNHFNTPLIFIYDGTNTHVFIDRGNNKIETKQFANTDFGQNLLQHGDLKILADVITYDSQNHSLVFDKQIKLNLDNTTQIELPTNQNNLENAQIKLKKVGQLSKNEIDLETTSISATFTPHDNTFYIILPKFELRWWFSSYPIGVHPFLNSEIPSIMYGKKGSIQSNLNLIHWDRIPEGTPKERGWSLVYDEHKYHPWMRLSLIHYREWIQYNNLNGEWAYYTYFAHFAQNLIPSKLWVRNTSRISSFLTAFSITIGDLYLVRLGDKFYRLENPVREFLEMHVENSKLYIQNLVTKKSFIISNYNDLIYNLADLNSLNPLWNVIIKDNVYFKPVQSLSIEMPQYNISENTTTELTLEPEYPYNETSYVEPTYTVQIPEDKTPKDFFVYATLEDADQIKFTDEFYIEVYYYFPSAYKNDTTIIPRAVGPLYVGWELEAKTPGLEFIADYFKWYESFADWFEIVAQDEELALKIRTFLPELHTTGVPDEYVGSY